MTGHYALQQHTVQRSIILHQYCYRRLFVWCPHSTCTSVPLPCTVGTDYFYIKQLRMTKCRILDSNYMYIAFNNKLHLNEVKFVLFVFQMIFTIYQHSVTWIRCLCNVQ